MSADNRGHVVKKKKDYIRLVPRPLLDAIVRGNAIPFVGAGFSTNCEGPDGFVMPNWKMLGKMAASEMGARSYDENPLEALSAYEERFQRAALVDLIRKACGDSCVTYGEPHKLLCGCFQNLICTTNFDSLLEQAFHGMGVNPLVVRTENCLARPFVRQSPQATKPRKSAPPPPTGVIRN